MNRRLLIALLFSTSPSVWAGDAFVTLSRTELSRNAAPPETDVVSADTLDLYRPTQVGDVLTRRTSVQTLPLGGVGSLSSVRIRGALSSQTLVLVDGRPLTGYSLGAANLAEIPVERIDRIEVVRGGMSSLYGANAIGGVINVITKRGAGEPFANVDVRLGSFGREELRANAGGAKDDLRYFLYGSQVRESGFRDNSDGLLRYGGGNLGIPLGAGGDLTVDASLFRGEIGAPGILFPAIPTNQFDNAIEKQASSPSARQDTDTRHLRVRHHLALPGNSVLTMRFSGLERTIDFVDPDFPLDSSRVDQSKGGDLDLRLPLGIVIGGGFSQDTEDSRDRLDSSNSFRETVEQWGLFAEEHWKGGPLTLLASGRYDHHSLAGDAFSPRLQLIGDATPWLRLSASGARSFRAPTLDDLFYRSTFFNGNPDLRPEKAWTEDVSVEAHDDRGRVALTYFRADAKDLIQVRPITFDTSVNIGRARRQGLELQGDQTISDRWRQSVNYTYLDNQGIPPGFNEYVTLSYSPRHTANHVLTWVPTPGWDADVLTRWVGSRYSGNNQTGTKLGAQVTWDLRLTRRLKSTELYFGVNDLLDKRYEEQAGFPLPGRTFFGGLQWRFAKAAQS